MFDDYGGTLPHLSLPLETLEELAARVTDRLPSALVDEIVRAVNARNRTNVSPSRIKSDLWRAGLDVTVEQVAWVVVNVMREKS